METQDTPPILEVRDEHYIKENIFIDPANRIYVARVR
jgi:hypothetical protein